MAGISALYFVLNFNQRKCGYRLGRQDTVQTFRCFKPKAWFERETAASIMRLNWVGAEVTADIRDRLQCRTYKIYPPPPSPRW